MKRTEQQWVGEHTPIVSVIVPVYNAELWLEECIDSVLGQTCEDIELICVDDGSTDRSADILAEYAKKDSRVRVFTQEHRNAGVARNRGIDGARGTFLAFLDADDFLEHDALTRLVATCEASEADVCLFGADYWDGQSFQPNKRVLRAREMPPFRPFSPDDVAEKIFNLGSVAPSTRITRRDFVLKHNLRFQEIDSCNDMLFTLAALALATTIDTLEEPLLHVRRGHQRTLASPIETQTLNAYRALIALRDFLRAHELYEAYSRSFENWALDFSVGMTQIFGGHLGIALRQRLVQGGFKELGLLGHPDDYFYYPQRVQDMTRILHQHTIPHKNLQGASIIILCPSEIPANRFGVALETSLFQTYPNTEVLCVCSSRDNELLAKLHVFTEQKVHLVDRQNYQSDGDAFASALASATGEYLCVLSAQDFLDARFLATVIAQMEEMNVSVGACNRIRFSHDLTGNIVSSPDSLFDWEDDYLEPLLLTDTPSLFTRMDSSRGMVVQREVASRVTVDFSGINGFAALADAWSVAVLAHTDNLAAVDMELWFTRTHPIVETEVSDSSMLFREIRDSVDEQSIASGINVRWSRRIIADYKKIPRVDMDSYITSARDALAQDMTSGALVMGDIQAGISSDILLLATNPVIFDATYGTVALSIVCDTVGAPSALSMTLSNLVDSSVEGDMEILCAVKSGGSIPDIVARYAETDSRVRIVRGEGELSLSAVATQWARGRYFLAVRPGERFNAGFLEDALKYADSHRADVLCFNEPEYFSGQPSRDILARTTFDQAIVGKLWRMDYLHSSDLHFPHGNIPDLTLDLRATAFAGTVCGFSAAGYVSAVPVTPQLSFTDVKSAYSQLYADFSPLNDNELYRHYVNVAVPAYLDAVARGEYSDVRVVMDGDTMAQLGFDRIVIDDFEPDYVGEFFERLRVGQMSKEDMVAWGRDYQMARIDAIRQEEKRIELHAASLKERSVDADLMESRTLKSFQDSGFLKRKVRSYVRRIRRHRSNTKR